VIDIQELTKVYGEQKAVDNISLKVEKGEILGFLGPNGAGKTTTMKIITCYMLPTIGDVTVGGFSVQEDSLEIRRMIGYLPESNPLYGDMNVVDFLRYIADLRGLAADQKAGSIKEMVDICGLGDVLHKNINQLSKGYRQRVGLAQAMIHDPDILILDEPTIGLDPNQVVDIRNLIKQLGREKTVILSTHILTEVQATCDRVAIINHGQIVADSSLADLQRDLEGKATINIEMLAAQNGIEELLGKVEGVDEVREVFPDSSQGRSFRVIAASGNDPREQLFKTAVEEGWVIIGMSREIRSLEEVFHKLTADNSVN